MQVTLVVVIHTNYWTVVNALAVSISLGLWVIFVSVYSIVWPKLGVGLGGDFVGIWYVLQHSQPFSATRCDLLQHRSPCCNIGTR